MKKILSILSTISLSTIISTNIIACQQPNKNKQNDKPIKQQLTPQQPPTNSNGKLITDKIILKNTGGYIIFYKGFGEFNTIKINSSKKFGNDIKKIIDNSLNDYKNINVYKGKLNNKPINLPKINISTGEIIDGN